MRPIVPVSIRVLKLHLEYAGGESLANGFHCDPDGSSSANENAAVAFFTHPSPGTITHSAIQASGGAGIDLAYAGAPCGLPREQHLRRDRRMPRHEPQATGRQLHRHRPLSVGEVHRCRWALLPNGQPDRAPSLQAKIIDAAAAFPPLPVIPSPHGTRFAPAVGRKCRPFAPSIERLRMTSIATSRRRFFANSALAFAAVTVSFACKGKVDSSPPGADASPDRAPSASPPVAYAGLTAILPGKVDGYRSDGEDGRYDRVTIFDLIDGGGEVFLALGVRAVVSRRYKKPGAPEVQVDLFDMGSSSDAFGAYHHDLREGKSAGIGHESEGSSSALFFWKDRYYASVIAFADNAQGRDAVLSVGRVVADRIAAPGEVPKLVGLLPPIGLVSSQLHYFHTWPLLQRHYQFADENLLGLASDTEGVLARYRDGDSGDASAALLLVRYPSADRAARAAERFTSRWLPGADAGIVRKQAGWAGVRQLDDLLIGVFDASSADRVRELFSSVDRRRKGDQ